MYVSVPTAARSNRPLADAFTAPLQQCLLAWIDMANKRAPPCCPVCATPYLVREDRSELLRLYKMTVRRWDKASTIVAIGGLFGGAWFVAAAYGAYAVKAFAGEQVAKALLLKHEQFPLRAWLNLPLIPLTLILSRTPLIDSLLPFLPLTLVLSTSSHPSPFADPDPLGLSNLSFTYPPSPTLTLCLLPWARLFYLKARHRVFDYVLGRKTRLEGMAALMETMRAADEGDFEAGVGQGRFEVVAEVEIEEHGVEGEGVDGAEILNGERPAAHGEEENGEQQQQQQQHAGEDAPPIAVANNRLRVGLSRITSLLVGALLYPTLCSLAGSALYFLASRQGARPSAPIKLLRKILGVQAVLAAARSTSFARGASGATNSFATSIVSWLHLLNPSSVSNAAGSAPIDPIWIRNFYGGGLILIARDAFELGAGVLERRRKESRKIVSRAFSEGLELGDENESAVSSGGRDANGRQATVRNML